MILQILQYQMQTVLQYNRDCLWSYLVPPKPTDHDKEKENIWRAASNQRTLLTTFPSDDLHCQAQFFNIPGESYSSVFPFISITVGHLEDTAWMLPSVHSETYSSLSRKYHVDY